VNLTRDVARCLVLTAAYAGGEPMSYAQAALFAPDDPERAFLRGRTDRLGRLAFQPPASGRWRVVMEDGLGHRLEESFDVQPDLAAPAGDSRPAAGLPVHLKALVGVSLVFGLAGLAALWRGRRRVVGGGRG
jgi:nickel transport protein